MPVHDQEQLTAIWRGQSVTPLRMTPEQLRTRAARFESAIRRRNLRDHVSFALVAIICAWGIFTHGLVLRVGCALIIAWALYSMVLLRRFGAMPVAPADSSAQTCAAYHRRQLERQRDIALSWPWGIGLAIPGFVLALAGIGLGARVPHWVFPVVMTGVFLFLYVALVIHGKMLAAQWQREIDSLHAITTGTMGGGARLPEG